MRSPVNPVDINPQYTSGENGNARLARWFSLFCVLLRSLRSAITVLTSVVVAIVAIVAGLRGDIGSAPPNTAKIVSHQENRELRLNIVPLTVRRRWSTRLGAVFQITTHLQDASQTRCGKQRQLSPSPSPPPLKSSPKR
ncbi:hypothetical protein BJX62DRAFT_215038 [Aspergillus germanicus]